MIDRLNRANPSDILALAKQARILSLQLEQGQACTPCSDAFTRLIDGPYSSSPSLAFVCLSETSKNSVVSDLMALGMVTTEHEKFGIRGAIGEFLVRITYITELSHCLGAWQEFTEDGQLLIVAGEHLVSEATRFNSSIADLVKSFPVVLVWLTDEGVDTESGWWHHSMIQSHASKPTVHRRVQSSFERLIASNNQVLRSLSATIRESQSFDWLQSAIAAFTARTQRELMRIKEAQSKTDGPNRLLMAKPLNADKDLVKIKEAVATSLSRIDKDLTLKSERGTQPLGKWTGLVREIASSLVVADLEQTQTSSALKLSVNAGHLAKLNRRIEHAIRQELTVDVGTVNRQVEQVVAMQLVQENVEEIKAGGQSHLEAAENFAQEKADALKSKIEEVTEGLNTLVESLEEQLTDLHLDVLNGGVDAVLQTVQETVESTLQSIIDELLDVVRSGIDEVIGSLEESDRESAAVREAIEPIIDQVEEFIEPLQDLIGGVKRVADLFSSVTSIF